MADPERKRCCPTCSRLLAQDAFYANCAECKDCKRGRSQRNRVLQARKIAVFERFVDALGALSDRTAEPKTTRVSERTTRAEVALSTPTEAMA